MSSIEAQRYARVAGILILLSIVFGTWGEAYVPSKLIVSTDAGATARNILSSPMLFRSGFAAYWVEAVCDVALALVRPASAGRSQSRAAHGVPRAGRDGHLRLCGVLLFRAVTPAKRCRLSEDLHAGAVEQP